MLNQWGIFSYKLVISGDQKISDQAKSAWGDTGSRELTISAKSAEQDPTKNLLNIATQRLSQEALDWNLFHWQENLWNYYINQKEKGLNTGFFVHEKFFRRIEFHLKTKCLVSSHSYTLVSRMYNESKKAFSWHKIFNFLWAKFSSSCTEDSLLDIQKNLSNENILFLSLYIFTAWKIHQSAIMYTA